MGLFAGVWLRKWGGGVCVLALGVCSWGFVELFAGVWLRKWGGGVCVLALGVCSWGFVELFADER